MRDCVEDDAENDETAEYTGVLVDLLPAVESAVVRVEDTFEVEDVVGWRYAEDGVTQEFRVRWKGFGEDDDTWEPKQNLLGGCEYMIDKMFEREAERTKRLAELNDADDDAQLFHPPDEGNEEESVLAAIAAIDSTDSGRGLLRDSFWHDLEKANEQNDPFRMEGIVAEVRRSKRSAAVRAGKNLKNVERISSDFGWQSTRKTPVAAKTKFKPESVSAQSTRAPPSTTRKQPARRSKPIPEHGEDDERLQPTRSHTTRRRAPLKSYAESASDDDDEKSTDNSSSSTAPTVSDNNESSKASNFEPSTPSTESPPFVGNEGTAIDFSSMKEPDQHASVASTGDASLDSDKMAAVFASVLQCVTVAATLPEESVLSAKPQQTQMDAKAENEVQPKSVGADVTTDDTKAAEPDMSAVSTFAAQVESHSHTSASTVSAAEATASSTVTLPSTIEEKRKQDIVEGSTQRPQSDNKLPLPVSMTSLSRLFKEGLRGQDISLSQDQLNRAVQRSDAETVRLGLLHDSKQPRRRLNADCVINGESLLYQVCKMRCDAAHQQDDIIEHLVSSGGANINFKVDNSGDSPIHAAVRSGSMCKVNRLIDLQVAINTVDVEGTTALMVATMMGHERMVRLLLDAGADVSAMTTFGDDMALHIVAASDTKHRPVLPRTASKLAHDLQQKKCAGAIDDHVAKVTAAFEQAMKRVLGDIRIKRQICSLHCYGVFESTLFRVVFPFETSYLPNDRFGYVVVLGLAKFNKNQMLVRMWGPSPVELVLLNDEELIPLTDEGRFLFACRLRHGQNTLQINLNPNRRHRGSDVKLLAQVYLMQLKQGVSISGPMPPSVLPLPPQQPPPAATMHTYPMI